MLSRQDAQCSGGTAHGAAVRHMFTDLLEVHFVELGKLKAQSVGLERRRVRWMLFLTTKTRHLPYVGVVAARPGVGDTSSSPTIERLGSYPVRENAGVSSYVRTRARLRRRLVC